MIFASAEDCSCRDPKSSGTPLGTFLCLSSKNATRSIHGKFVVLNPGGTPENYWWGGVPAGSPNPGPVSDQRMSFFTSVQFLDLASKIHTCFKI